MKVKKYLDAKGLTCPMPLVQTRKAIEEIKTGEILEIHATDSGAKSDLTAWAKSVGHELLKETEKDGVVKFWIKKG